jgi:hypothetical protein
VTKTHRRRHLLTDLFRDMAFLYRKS